MQSQLLDFLNRFKTPEIKSTIIYPGSMNTSSWDGLEVDREKFIQPSDITSLIDLLLNLSPNAWVEEITIRPRGEGY